MKVDSNKVWKQIEEDITFFSSVNLKIGEREVSITMQKRKMKLVYMVYVDGFFKGIWSDKESEVGAAFLCPMYMMLPSVKLCNSMVKILGKRRAKKEGYVPKKELYACTPYFKSFRSLKSVLSKHKDIVWLNPPVAEQSDFKTVDDCLI